MDIHLRMLPLAEFLILLLGYKQVGPAEVAERIRTQVAETDFGVGHAITVSMGVTVAKPNESMMKLYLRADAALYDAYCAGAGRAKRRAGPGDGGEHRTGGQPDARRDRLH